jgi:lactoylglutathione lyase
MKYNWIYEGKLRWCWLQNGGAALMLQEFWKEGHHANVPTEKLGVDVSVCFICEDALAFYYEVTLRGIKASEPFVGNNMWVKGLSDPDGYQIYFESATDVPEETTYSEWKKNNKSIKDLKYYLGWMRCCPGIFLSSCIIVFHSNK